MESRTNILAHGLHIIFVGFNPSPASYAKGFNYAGRSNRFYKILYAAGLTNEPYVPEESRVMAAKYGFGFTNIVQRPTKSAADLTPDDYREGRVELRRTLSEYQPAVACYVGKGVYEAFAKPRTSVNWGFQPVSQLPGTLDFVAPSSSGLVRMTLADQVAIYSQLADWLKTQAQSQ